MSTTYTIEDLKKFAEEKYGKCISTVYTKMKADYDWICSEVHPFTKSWDSVKSKKSWCPKCSKSEQAKKRRKYTIKDLQKIAENRGGKCLSTEYTNSNHEYTWQCSEDHTWDASFETIKKHWCGKCANSVMKSLEDMHELAKKKNGKCISTDYQGAHVKLIWECHQGHKFPKTPDQVNQGSWCPDCYEQVRGDLRRKNTIEDAQRIAAAHKGKCLSTTYKNTAELLEWECEKGHRFPLRYSNASDGVWCKKCGYESVAESKRKYNIENMKVIAEKHGGHCLSKSYKSNAKKLRWKCANGHLFSKSYSHIERGQWCPKCSSGINEEKSRYILENLFNKPFIKSRSALGKGLELDGYNQEIKIAFEYQGEQHYELTKPFHRTKKDFIEQVARDEEKRLLCKKLGIILLEIPYTAVSDKDKIDILFKQFDIFQITPFRDKSYVMERMKDFYLLSMQLKELQQIAVEKGGKLLSEEYINSNHKLDFVCREGHEFPMKPVDVKKGIWCRLCGFKSMAKKITTHTIEEMQEIARQRGGKCLSSVYVRSSDKLDWLCSKGHPFSKSQENIAAGQWCPKCSKEEAKIKLRQKGYEVCLELAKSKNATLVSDSYTTSTKKLDWECEFGHPFKRSRTDVQIGRWCYTCRDNGK